MVSNMNYVSEIPNSGNKNILSQLLNVITNEKIESKIKFAWEFQGNSQVKKAIDCFKNSTSIVVIGYSFPYYNRAIDFQIWDELFSNSDIKTIYLQYPDKVECEKIERRIRLMLKDYDYKIPSYDYPPQGLKTNYSDKTRLDQILEFEHIYKDELFYIPDTLITNQKPKYIK